MAAPSLPGIDWHEVRTLAVAVGVREAARQMGLNEEAVKARSRRESWLADRHQATASLTRESREKALKVIAPNAPVAPTAADILSKMGSDTRAALASVASKAAKRLDKLEPDELLSKTVAEVASSYTGMASKLHGWERTEKDRSSGIVINIGLAGLTPEVAIADISDMPIAEP